MGAILKNCLNPTDNSKETLCTDNTFSFRKKTYEEDMAAKETVNLVSYLLGILTY